jgi:hypothetical protein
MKRWFPRLLKRSELPDAPSLVSVESHEDWLADFVIKNRPELEPHIPFIMVLAQAYHRRKLNE